MAKHLLATHFDRQRQDDAQVWTGGGEAGVTSLGGPPGTALGALIDGTRAWVHAFGERNITIDQYHESIDAARADYLQTFGQEAFQKATGCNQVKGCPYNDTHLPVNMRPSA